MAIQKSSSIRNLLQSLRAASFSSMIANDHRFTSQAYSPATTKPSGYSGDFSDDEDADVNWDKLGFGLTQTDYMYVMSCCKDQRFLKGQLCRYANIELSPSAGGVYEGMKANRTQDGRILLFRADQNAGRMRHGAERMCMPSPSIDQFIDAVKETVSANKRWIPPPGKGSLYVRPMLLGTGPILGLAPAPEYTFLIYVSPVGYYFKEGTAPLNLYIEEEYVRASPGGAGGVKSITNYAPVMKAITKAKDRGFSDVLYLDAINKKYLEEVSSCNIFIVKGNVISTPATNGTILEGVTRKSIIEIAKDHGYQVEERSVAVDELVDADDAVVESTKNNLFPVK
ncbi:hypothetical protein PVK06_016365 [Gossypium arboreum]|uniref:Branched-chain-amino-acid aminotransferase n=1 Tax=Gossypium arboreum TaxID=29729 RepID=A0ABR0Q0N2_GOSAR|nr:hypothetical protein PVK06_016365 [Gossypium arboreum]